MKLTASSLLALFLVTHPLTAAEPAFAAVGPVLKTYCVSCHGGAKPKGDFDLTALAPDFAANGEAWKGVMGRVADGSMPPKGKPKPTAEERQAVEGWVASGLTAHQLQRVAADGRSRVRRLNRIEYANTLRDLIGAEVDIETLPEDGKASGFDNVDAALDLSSTLLERYLETADAALDNLFVKGPPPKSATRHIDMVPLAKQLVNNVQKPRFGDATLIREKDVVFLTDGQSKKVIQEARVPIAGRYRFRISTNTFRTHGKDLSYLIYASDFRGVGSNVRLVGAFDVPADTPTVNEFTLRLEVRQTIRIEPYGLPPINAGKMTKDYAGPGLAVGWVEVEGPLPDSWPLAEKARLLGGVNLASATAADAETILRRFAARAFRRPVADADLAPYMAIVTDRLKAGYDFEAALRVALKAILCSPDFLYLSASPGRLNDFDLAARLSYFLWSSTPDDALEEAAAKGELATPDGLRRQVERLLADPKARAFTENFTGQWLDLRNLKATVPDKKLYPEFDALLELSLPGETHAFFEEVLKNDRSLLEFIDSDWSMLNGRLAEHYGVPGVNGFAIRKVPLPPACHRGGIMTQASVLKVTANGTTTSPIIRGAWVLDRILGTPAPPPPKDVPAIEPDIRGAKSIREQLAKHRAIASCAACHTQIDPPGYALENFDVIGGWRENYRATPESTKEKIFVKRADRLTAKPIGKGPRVAAGDQLADGRTFANVDDFKKLLLEHPEVFARSLAEKLLVYGTGHGLEFADRAAVANIVAAVQAKNYGFRTLIHTIVQSPTFRSK